MSEALQVLPTAVSNAVTRKQFPPAWYYTCKSLADSKGVDCPKDLFGQRPVHNTPIVDADAIRQGGPVPLHGGAQ